MKNVKIHLTVPVTRYSSYGWPMYGSFESACGRLLGSIKVTNRRARVTCRSCKRRRAK